MYTGGNLTIRAQNLCRTETLPKSHANNDAAMWLAYNTNGLYTVSLNNKWSDRIINMIGIIIKHYVNYHTNKVYIKSHLKFKMTAITIN